jgi:hypothetical protein
VPRILYNVHLLLFKSRVLIFSIELTFGKRSLISLEISPDSSQRNEEDIMPFIDARQVLEMTVLIQTFCEIFFSIIPNLYQ